MKATKQEFTKENFSHLIQKFYEINYEALNAKPDHRLSEIEALWNRILDQSYADTAGNRRWISNRKLIPTWVLTIDACLVAPKFHQMQFDIEQDKAIEAYRASQPAQPSAEEMFEMRAAFGEGVEVVDVITGRRVTT
jgi:hypothetical protein